MHKDENIKLSIIVPVYNVEKYLKQCLESILGQQYTNFELLLIDDGSTDESSKICDDFAISDSRIRVFHKENGGLSSARNFGIQNAIGDYLGFVDSDDWIYDDMYSSMMSIALEKDASIVCCNHDLFVKGKIKKRGTSGIKEYDRETAIYKLFFNNDYYFFACNKIYKKELFKDIQYPDGKHFEDITTTYRLFKKVNKIYFSSSSGYVYRIRQDSITGTRYNSKTIELVEAIDYVFKDIQTNYPDILDYATVGYIDYYRGFINRAIAGKAPDLKIHHNRLKKIIHENSKNIIKCNEISYKIKILILMCGYFGAIYRIMILVKYYFK